MNQNNVVYYPIYATDIISFGEEKNEGLRMWVLFGEFIFCTHAERNQFEEIDLKEIFRRVKRTHKMKSMPIRKLKNYFQKLVDIGAIETKDGLYKACFPDDWWRKYPQFEDKREKHGRGY